MTEILTLTAAPGPVGNIGVAAVARTTVRPYINVDQSFVIVKADPEEDQYNVVFFEEGEDESPVAISEYLYALFEGDTGPTSEAAQLAAIAMENGKFETVMNKRQLQKIAGRDAWATLLSSAPLRRGDQQGVDPPPADSIIGRVVVDVPIMIMEGTVMKNIVISGLVADGEHAGEVTIITDEASEHAVPERLARAFLKPVVVPVDVSDYDKELQRVLKGMQHSSSPSFSSKEICAFELARMAPLCGLPARFVTSLIDRSSPGEDRFLFAADAFLLELEAALEGKVLGSSWASVPEELGEQLRVRAAAGFTGLPPGAIASVPTLLPQRSSSLKLADAYHNLFSVKSEYTAFLKGSVDITSEPHLAAVNSKTELRMEGALDRFLRGLSVQPSEVAELPSGLDGESAIQSLLEFVHRSKSSTPSASAGAATSTTDLVSQTAIAVASQLVAPSSQKGVTNQDRLESSSVRDAFRAVRLDAGAMGRLEAMKACVRSNDLIGLEKLKMGETDSNMNILIHADIDDDFKMLEGAGSDSELATLSVIRGGFLERIMNSMYPDTKFINLESRVTRAFALVKAGKLAKVKLMHLLDLSDESGLGDNVQPLKSFATRAEPLALLQKALNFVRDTITLVSPSQISEAMYFFRKLYELIEAYRARHCPWTLLSPYYRAIMQVVQAPAVAFGRGDTSSLVLVDLSPAVFSRDTAWALKLDQQLTDHRHEENAKLLTKKPAQPSPPPKLPKAPSAPSAPKAPSTPGQPGAGKIAQADWAELFAKMKAEVPEKDGKSPCAKFFIKGVCAAGATCQFHHGGVAGSVKKQ